MSLSLSVRKDRILNFARQVEIALCGILFETKKRVENQCDSLTVYCGVAEEERACARVTIFIQNICTIITVHS
jgi:hypothetical protein